ncbi:1-acyl-sn-glycerol-3-phosphate acyltransferase [Hamadaea flava]|uniref:Lysophospholipid acyltransferase family protein n=1 Tax=Hamadaea flava TaxID=1742688 RepID=A0ABV8LV76_9ACTN|nr:lysophospholipid acyltransferase family protein [Hamadaea flava]MCP2327766.1 1-acyl-sn-glycerol-3-phosphate acyltransferase [Hamadaea flava]
MPELVYPPVIALARTMFTLLDMRVRVEGGEHVPRTGGAVIACNHISYLDFIFCGFGARPSKRLVRFMAKQEIFAHPVGGPLMRGMKHIPVDREAGIGSYKAALAALKAGEVVGIFPEATISQSFTVKEIKNGAVRLAAAAEVPLIPMALWGTQRMWTKGRPRTLTKRNLPISVLIGEPMRPARRDKSDEVTAALRARMAGLLDRAQTEYPEKPEAPGDDWWLPAHLGGGAPLPDEVE